MRILCLISTGPGHLDFGGNGCSRVIKELSKKGHNVVLMSSEAQYNKLDEPKIEFYFQPLINDLMLLLELTEINQVHQKLVLSLKMIELDIASQKPDLILVDRILGFCDPLLQHLKIPYISIGTNGSLWRKKNGYNLYPEKSIHNYNGVFKLLTHKLHWPYTTCTAWCSSPFLNITFIGDDFYPKSSAPSINLNLYSDRQFHKKELRIGLSLGNRTFEEKDFCEKITDMIKFIPPGTVIDVFGEKEKAKGTIDKIVKDEHEFNLLGFVDFNQQLQNYSHLIFPGGISTLWYCIEFNVIPIIVSGQTHDQFYNSLIVKSLFSLNESDAFTNWKSYNDKAIQLKQCLLNSSGQFSKLDEIIMKITTTSTKYSH